jgi:hypothetical protein
VNVLLFWALTWSQMPVSAPPDVVEELRAVEERLSSTYAGQDCDGWGSLLADEWTVTHITGNVVTKTQAIEACRKGPAVKTTYDDLVFRAYGDTAIVAGQTTASVTGPPAQRVILRFTDVLVRRGGKWLVVASHATRVAD